MKGLIFCRKMVTIKSQISIFSKNSLREIFSKRKSSPQGFDSILGHVLNKLTVFYDNVVNLREKQWGFAPNPTRAIALDPFQNSAQRCFV